MHNRLIFKTSILKFICISAFALLCSDAYCQKQANIWHLGNNRAIDFTSGEPVEISGSAISAYEGCASYCDSLGNLLFYSNGGGYETFGPTGNIWNAANESIYDMQGIEGGGYSAMQSSVFIEAPGELGKYYLFTMDDREYYLDASDSVMNAQPQGRGLSYFKIDQSLNGGLGEVIEANQLVYAPSAEALCAVKHANGSDYWILINQDSSGIGIYRVTSAGVELSSVYTIPEGTFYMIKASPDGSKLFVLLDDFPVGTGVLLQFDPASGTISNRQELNTYEGIFYFEFSPNSRYLYFANGATIGRYDVSSSNIASTFTSFFDFSSIDGFSYISQMQLGPDGKIYALFVEYDSVIELPVNTLNRIVCPNTANPSFEYEVLTFIGSASEGNFNGLPNFPAWIFENYDSTYVALGPDNVRLCDVGGSLQLNAGNPGATYLWSTGSTEQSITVDAPGTYFVTVTGSCGAGSDTIVISACEVFSECIEFLPTGDVQTWTVPEGVDSVRVKIWGAAGGGGPDSLNNAGGGGGYTELKLPVVAGDVFEIVVGVGGLAADGNTGGAGGYGGGGDGGSGNRQETVFGVLGNYGGAGGGGGLSLIRMQGSINNIIGIAGGGGGGAFNRSGGGGGGLEAEFTSANNSFNIHGFGGTQSAGGAPASNTICGNPVSGLAGDGQQGGNGATDLGGSNDRTGGGGGGSGYFGGGGGSSHDGCFGVGSGGGGGSGFVCNTCPGLTGFTVTAGFFGLPANADDPELLSYPGTAAGINNQNGGGGLVLICTISGCLPTTDSIAVTACESYTTPNGAQLSQSGLYSFTLTSANGCDSIIVLDLTISNTVVKDTLVVSSCNRYSAPWGDVYTETGIYSDTLILPNDCDSVLTIDLTIFDGPQLSIAADNILNPGELTLVAGDSLQLNANGAVTYSWSPGSGLSCTNCPNPWASPTQTTLYTVTGLDSSGCIDTAQVKIIVDIRCNELFIPSIFSPNAKGPEANETLCLFSNCVDQLKFVIHNRWGQKVFETEDINSCWDGTFNGQEVQSGVYAFNLYLRQLDGTVVNKTGTITLVK